MQSNSTPWVPVAITIRYNILVVMAESCVSDCRRKGDEILCLYDCACGL